MILQVIYFPFIQDQNQFSEDFGKLIDRHKHQYFSCVTRHTPLSDIRAKRSQLWQF